jgi:hypothetical protein
LDQWNGSEDQFTILEYAIIIWKSSTTTIFFNGIARKLVGVKPNSFLAHYRGSLVVVQRAESNILVEEHAATAGFSAAAESSPTLPGIPGYTHFCLRPSSGVMPNS